MFWASSCFYSLFLLCREISAWYCSYVFKNCIISRASKEHVLVLVRKMAFSFLSVEYIKLYWFHPLKKKIVMINEAYFDILYFSKKIKLNFSQNKLTCTVIYLMSVPIWKNFVCLLRIQTGEYILKDIHGLSYSFQANFFHYFFLLLSQRTSSNGTDKIFQQYILTNF